MQTHAHTQTEGEADRRTGTDRLTDGHTDMQIDICKQKGWDSHTNTNKITDTDRQAG